MSKKTEQINAAVTPADYARAKALERTHGIRATEMARIGLLEVMNRVEFGLPVITPAEAQLIAEARALGIDPVAAIRDRLAATQARDVESP